ncbi:HNH endonuclease [Haloplasma contractile]|uniref:HNH domain-containing protein n=1 Tax=Haloplasma contractile SSD-17B TaxID=1033810 RepID=F7Q1Q5_9MOLU|nr:HNH endonuclease [Haloplasma contractile]ERJ12282.1 hypothetical protein HLPCO_001809 [Haloplasma contractile SSD-17B]
MQYKNLDEIKKEFHIKSGDLEDMEFLCKKCHNAEHKRFMKLHRFDKYGNILQI